MNETKTKTDKTPQNGVKQHDAAKDSTIHNITGTTLDNILLDYINGRTTIKQRILNVTSISANNGGGLRIETEDAA